MSESTPEIGTPPEPTSRGDGVTTARHLEGTARPGTAGGDQPAEYITGTMLADLADLDDTEDLRDVLDARTFTGVRTFYRKHGMDRPEYLAEMPVVPVALVAGLLADLGDAAPTLAEVAADAAEYGNVDPHDQYARLKRQRAQRIRRQKEAKREQAQEHPEGMTVGPLGRLFTVSELAELPPPTPLIDGFLYRETLAQLSGAPGSGKTFLTLAMACSLALGRPFGRHKVPEAVPVVYVAAEGHTGLSNRIAAWCGLHKVDPAALDKLHILPGPAQLNDPEHMADLAAMVKETGAGLVVLDTRARCTVGLEENSATEQGRAIATVDALISATKVAVYAIHHLGSKSERGRGSTAWDGAVWSDLTLTREGNKVTVKCKKHKDVPDGCAHDFDLAPYTLPLSAMPHELDEARRSSLVVTAHDPFTEAVPDSYGDVLAVVTSTSAEDGLSMTTIIKLVTESHGHSESTTRRAVKDLVDTARLAKIGTKTRPRYVPAPRGES